MEKYLNLLRAVEETMEKVQVSGADNMDRLLGCIQVVRGIRYDLSQINKEVQKNAETGNSSVRERDEEDPATSV